jgi:secreted trypsin-like serine protease
MDIGKLPFAALLTRQGKIHCGATVIANRFLLTAAHCVDGFELGHLRAFMGHGTMKNIDKAIIHNHYNDETYNHDIALLQMESPIEFGATIAPVCLPLDKRDPTGKKGTVVGWGDTSEDGNPSSMPRHANVTIHTKRQCKNMRYESHTISKNMVRAIL